MVLFSPNGLYLAYFSAHDEQPSREMRDLGVDLVRALGGLDPRGRVLENGTPIGREVQPGCGEVKDLGVWFAELHVFCADHNLEAGSNLQAVQHEVDILVPGVGRQRDGNSKVPGDLVDRAAVGALQLAADRLSAFDGRGWPAPPSAAQKYRLPPIAPGRR